MVATTLPSVQPKINKVRRSSMIRVSACIMNVRSASWFRERLKKSDGLMRTRAACANGERRINPRARNNFPKIVEFRLMPIRRLLAIGARGPEQSGLRDPVVSTNHATRTTPKAAAFVFAELDVPAGLPRILMDEGTR